MNEYCGGRWLPINFIKKIISLEKKSVAKYCFEPLDNGIFIFVSTNLMRIWYFHNANIKIKYNIFPMTSHQDVSFSLYYPNLDFGLIIIYLPYIIYSSMSACNYMQTWGWSVTANETTVLTICAFGCFRLNSLLHFTTTIHHLKSLSQQ